MWTCGRHANRLFLANVVEGTVTMMELVGFSYSEDYLCKFSCPTVLFGGNVIGVRGTSRERGNMLKMDLLNVSTDQLLEECPENRNLQQICSDQFLVYIMEVNNGSEFLLLCIENNGNKIRKAMFPCYPHGNCNDTRMIISERQEQLFIHVLSNEASVSLLSLFL
jgi:hypothetical protein